MCRPKSQIRIEPCADLLCAELWAKCFASLILVYAQLKLISKACVKDLIWKWVVGSITGSSLTHKPAVVPPSSLHVPLPLSNTFESWTCHIHFCVSSLLSIRNNV